MYTSLYEVVYSMYKQLVDFLLLTVHLKTFMIFIFKEIMLIAYS